MFTFIVSTIASLTFIFVMAKDVILKRRGSKKPRGKRMQELLSQRKSTMQSSSTTTSTPSSSISTNTATTSNSLSTTIERILSTPDEDFSPQASLNLFSSASPVKYSRQHAGIDGVLWRYTKRVDHGTQAPLNIEMSTVTFPEVNVFMPTRNCMPPEDPKVVSFDSTVSNNHTDLQREVYSQRYELSHLRKLGKTPKKDKNGHLMVDCLCPFCGLIFYRIDETTSHMFGRKKKRSTGEYFMTESCYSRKLREWNENKWTPEKDLAHPSEYEAMSIQEIKSTWKPQILYGYENENRTISTVQHQIIHERVENNMLARRHGHDSEPESE